MIYRIDGTDQKTGNDRAKFVVADSKTQAAAMAQKVGIFASEVQECPHLTICRACKAVVSRESPQCVACGAPVANVGNHTPAVTGPQTQAGPDLATRMVIGGLLGGLVAFVLSVLYFG